MPVPRQIAQNASLPSPIMATIGDTSLPMKTTSSEVPKVAITVKRAMEETDPRLPRNWPIARKWSIIIIISLLTLTVSMSLVISTPATTLMAQEFNDHDHFTNIFYITVPNLGQIFGPLYIGPLSERYGRLPITHIFNVLFLAFNLISGFSNSFSMLIALRLLGGLSISSVCLNIAITGDLFAKKGRGTVLSLASLIPIAGSALGPVAGGYITQYLTWRWNFWLIAMLNGLLTIVMAIMLRETYAPVVRRRARLSNPQISPEKEASRRVSKYIMGFKLATFKALILLALRPFIILSSSYVAILMTVYVALLFSQLSLLAASLATVYQDVYGFTEGQSGLVYIAQTGGTITGSLYCSLTLDYFLTRGLCFSSTSRSSDGDIVSLPTESRLVPAIPAFIMFPIGLLLYGWSLHFQLHWMVPALATGFCGFGFSAATVPTMNYVVDMFGDRAASAVAAVLPLRYMFGALLPISGPYLHASLGYGWTYTLFALILVVMTPLILWAVFRGKKMEVQAEEM